MIHRYVASKTIKFTTIAISRKLIIIIPKERKLRKSQIYNSELIRQERTKTKEINFIPLNAFLNSQ
jgi:hypothetical protein